MSDNLKLNKLELLSRKGNYQEIIQLLEGKITTLDQLWYLTEANLECENLNKADELLNQWKSSCSSPNQEIHWNYFHGRIFIRRGLYSEAKKSLNYSMEMLNQIKQPSELLSFQIRLHLGICYWKQGLSDKALDLFKNQLKSIEKYKNETNFQAILASTYHYVGASYFNQNKIKESLVNYQKALKLKLSIGNPQEIFKSLNNLANIYYSQGRLQEALDYHKRAFSFTKKVGNSIGIAISLNNIGNVYIVQGRLKDALDQHEKSLKLKEKLENEHEIAKSLINIANIFYAQGRLQEAEEYYLRALQLLDKIGNPLEIAESLFNLGRVEKSLNKLSSNSFVFDRFPPPPHESPVTTTFYRLIKALLAQIQEDWSLANELFNIAFETEGLEYEYKIFSIESLAEIALEEWLIKSKRKALNQVEGKLKAYEQLCRENYLTAHLCKVYLLRSKLNQTLFQFKDSENLLLQCQLIAEESGLPLHYKLASKELESLKEKKKLINDLKIVSKEISLEEFAGYFKDLSKQLLAQEEK
ncbi:MAG: tetratricopeptide repeat protein [Candidatus Hodarchaeales archaeon]|jgi:tetratricopeptide (TPR) repeat protein